MSDIILSADVNVEAEIARLGKRYEEASGVGMRFLTAVGGQAENLLDRLPPPVRAGLTDATVAALHQAVRVADGSRTVVPDQQNWVNTAVGTGLGAAGGFGGFPTALAEVPVTTTFLLRVIQGVAAREGFDPKEPGVRFDCVNVFAAAGPLSHDDDADLGFLSARMALQGAALRTIVNRVAPKLAAVLGQKLAAQTVPVLGAIAGASTNYVYTRYYTEMAHVHFGLRRLGGDSGVPQEELVARLSASIR